MANRVYKRFCIDGQVWVLAYLDDAALSRLETLAAAVGMDFDTWLDSEIASEHVWLEGLRAGGHDIDLEGVRKFLHDWAVAELAEDLEEAMVESGEFELLTDGRWRKKGEG